MDDDVNSVVHLAGKANDVRDNAKGDEYYKVNFEYTQYLYDTFLQSNARVLIFISSVKAAADGSDKVLMEDVIPNPETHYGKSQSCGLNNIFRSSLFRNGNLIISQTLYDPWTR